MNTYRQYYAIVTIATLVAVSTTSQAQPDTIFYDAVVYTVDADFVVLDHDIMRVPPSEILKTKVDMTVLGMT